MKWKNKITIEVIDKATINIYGNGLDTELVYIDSVISFNMLYTYRDIYDDLVINIETGNVETVVQLEADFSESNHPLTGKAYTDMLYAIASTASGIIYSKNHNVSLEEYQYEYNKYTQLLKKEML